MDLLTTVLLLQKEAGKSSSFIAKAPHHQLTSNTFLLPDLHQGNTGECSLNILEKVKNG